MSKPVIVIRKLEDSPEWLDRRLVAAYLATVYRVELAAAGAMEGGVVELYPGYGHSRYFARWLATQNCDTYSIITACNPASVRLSAEENAENNKKLASDLGKISRLLLPALKPDPDDRWPPEESFSPAVFQPKMRCDWEENTAKMPLFGGKKAERRNCGGSETDTTAAKRLLITASWASVQTPARQTG